MAFQSLLFVSIFYVTLCWKIVRGQQLYNITIDDNDAKIRYSGDWRRSLHNELNEGGSHMIAHEATATAIVEFEGEMLAPLLRITNV